MSLIVCVLAKILYDISTTLFTGLDLLLFEFIILEKFVKGSRFSTIKQIKTASLEELKVNAKSAYQKCFEDRKNAVTNISGRDYYEGQKANEIIFV